MLYAFRDVIRRVYSTTNIKADGLVATVKFADHIDFELMPGIRKDDGSFNYPISNGGGSWGRTVPMPEIEAMDALHGATNRNARKLARMVRAWKDYNGVTMGGLLIDTYVHRFLKDYGYKTGGYVYYDWMTRDFFKFLSEQNDQVSYIYALGSNQLIYLKGGFTYKAKVAYQHALNAIEAYDKEFLWTSKNHWQSIYGTKFPDFS